MPEHTPRLIMDVDTGVDDALALALAVRHPRARLESVLTVAGNVDLERTTRNTVRVLDWLEADHVPVFAGADRPLVGEVREASHWHADDGLGGAHLPPPRRSADPDAAAHLVRSVLADPGALTVVATGPLTNLALAVEREPRVVSAVREVVLMGGAALPPGNVTPVAEFNIYADPEAAAIVFSQAWPVTMVGLDVTQRVRLTRERRATLVGRADRAAALVWEVTRWLFDERQVDSMALHDPLAVAVALEPDLVQTIERAVVVETRGEHTRGQTVVDWRPVARSAPNRHVCTGVDASRFEFMFAHTLGL